MKRISGSVLIVAPYEDEEAFYNVIRNSIGGGIEFLNYSTTKEVSKSFWKRHFFIFRMALKSIGAGQGKNYIFFGEQFIGLYYAFLSRIFFWIRCFPKSVVIQIIYNKKKGFVGFLYKLVYGWLLASKSLSVLVCHSSQEREYYAIEFGKNIRDKLFFVPFGRGQSLLYASENSVVDRRYFFSGGTSNRDYKTLIEAFRGLDAQLLIACHERDVSGIDIPGNVEIRHDIFGTDFLDCICNSYAVVLPISNTSVSAGQLVLIDSMRAGKASIITEGSCMADYTDSDCSIFVQKQDVNGLKAAVNFLNSSESLCLNLGTSSEHRYIKEFTRSSFAERLCRLLLGDI